VHINLFLFFAHITFLLVWLCQQTAQQIKPAVRRHAELLLVVFAASSCAEATMALATVATALATAVAATLSVFARLQVAYINFFFFFAHITFL
jgi:hypothetical protein